jgi:hypothetical protein
MSDAEIIGSLLGQVVGVLLSPLMQAVVLKWRLKSLNLQVNYWHAYFFSLRIIFVVALITFGFGLAIGIAGFSEGGYMHYLVVAIAIGSWWFMHSNSLIAFAGKRSGLITLNQAQKITIDVLLISSFIWFALALVALIVIRFIV